MLKVNYIKEIAQSLGIDAVSFISIQELESIYEKQQVPRNLFPSAFFPQAKTLISVAFSYNYDFNQTKEDTYGYIARYTTANFYLELSQRLKKLAGLIKDQQKIHIPKYDYYRVFVNSRLKDKPAAYYSHLGAYLKNSCIAVRGLGSRIVLGELLLAEEISGNNDTQVLSCEDCNLCIKSCPTGALDAFKLDKNKCLQHLSSETTWPDNASKLNIIKSWGKRFFGCTKCLDICPQNKNILIKTKTSDLIGFIGTTCDPLELLKIHKQELKKLFAKNQLSANWINPLIYIRNSFIVLHNCKNFIPIKKFFSYELDWTGTEIDYLKNFMEKHF